ncbi:TPA: two-component system sensor histidine kinase/response regulator SagS [Pseudomonas aeruginosa]|uniref:two-component system sensor histidine kinase/response regulator SagS n=1 Tax=Pseudomonas aeruginosa TaxID=287 RepID=UPI0004632760|nr:two-component system sensor histidine kinase/response regulator SagS [Pseudomonas aeruginosa]EKV4570408.1 two-component system sensor histidine kinase/response regulator SagS [Pseudomonas aeruginosa]KSD40602.1 hybrid sensor histidine kinase/response regulator [Pseudomonas aeruginosa]MBH8873279.1 two-component system sensor histidine kinase/response regulator SagS [Pseudomonas aeruginosa]MBI8969218.1 two-component system sensor histidine kinase/response regulator SagS [Pseudomonas aeruginosa]
MLGGRTSPRLIPAPMDIALTHRLSFKQASLTVLVAFILGTLLSLIQVGVDYASQDASINREVRALLDVSHNPAARIAYNIDAELAQELVLGLLRSPAVVRAEIIDTSGLPLASASREPAESSLRPLSDFLFGHKRVYEDPLHVDHAPGEALGVLHLEIDTFVFGNDFLRRAGITLLSGFVRSLLLSLILLVLFYTLLTKPLVSLTQALSGHDPRSPARMHLPCPKGHERDEIGVLVEVINRQLGRISVEIEQRREAENRLTQYLEELESIVAARTAELKAANARLTLSNQELEEARQTALDMAQARASFLANMSHEIRTPLNGLLGMLSLSLDGPLTPEQRQQLSIAHDSGKVLVELLNDVLDLSKFEAGQLVLEQIPFDLGVLVEDTASLLSQNAAAGVELTCLVDPALPAQVSGDPTRIRQVVSNLLSNALKFTRLGRVDVRVEATAEGVRISVRDTGIGIAQEALDRIFQPFTQADAGITRQYGGTGLGLALTRKLCEAMQGELTVESTVGLGSLFSVGLPLAPVSPPLQPLPLRGRVIAQCSANSGLAQLLQTWLPRWGLEYKRLETDDSLLGHSLDVLISDCPDCLMGLRPSIGTPILLVTAYGSFLEPELARRLSPLRQLARPLSRNQLYQALKNVLEHTAIAPSTASDAAGAQRNTRVLLVEDNPVNQLVAKGLLHKLGCQVWIAEHGLNALKMLEEHPIDLVLMDCNMPVMDGYEATRQIRDSGRWGGLPIIALTANALPDERERCRAAGMDDYLAKPFHRDELKAILDRWCPLAASD